MLICGLKLTHDGGIAVVEDGTLLCSIEMEKLDGNPRYQPLDRLEAVENVLARQGIDLADLDAVVVDGWMAAPGEPAPVLRELTHRGRPVAVEVAPYSEADGAAGPALHRYEFDGLPLGDRVIRYTSYHHVTQHLLGAYCTSPFAARGESALGMVWDGGTVPRLYRVDPVPFQVQSLGPLFPLYGNAFADYCAQWDPFRSKAASLQGEPDICNAAVPRNLDVAGKAMAYAALGRDEPTLYQVFDTQLDCIPLTFDTGIELAEWCREHHAAVCPGGSDADFIASFQGYLGARLLTALRERLAELAPDVRSPNLCLSGGCALNIKWNSQIRNSELFREVWIPPFPNDSGAAIGTAVAEMVCREGRTALNWDVFRGPQLPPATEVPGWTWEPCDAAGLAKVLHETAEPVVVLNGRAELGPRALGGRSIIAPAIDPKTKDRLNDIKGRANYRPVAPICLEHRAPEIFSPGCPDPYMLFDHEVRPGWHTKIPAVVHLDGTARLQTVTERDNPLLAAVLTDYEQLSGVPVLCNTSANDQGCGFFPDVRAAARWGRVDLLWSEGRLYSRR
ncbi:nodulation protein U [Streptomyces sp. BHT-5-2]|uniref:carbamoyltransferase N-terminal domain-containing protein n=1 Tax=Streptomyces sp. BHT-5-2 TaxID=2866715 RepID=UPI001C8E28F7|nr:carbamoyltransferase N-terminal domain-containing protein [Streptomyces sp. BHT-5-2]QZL04560.1 nodulation protein U [Streptomyces sp. BHT-5-2]